LLRLGRLTPPPGAYPGNNAPPPNPLTLVPDPNLPTFSDYLAMTPAPRVPQPYQERFLAALQDGSRLETWQERWDRERNESLERFNDAIKRTIDSFLAFGRACSKNLATLRPFMKVMQEQGEFERGPTIGRKRRARRVRGRRRGNA
jgi:hypothetical protein